MQFEEQLLRRPSRFGGIDRVRRYGSQFWLPRVGIPYLIANANPADVPALARKTSRTERRASDIFDQGLIKSNAEEGD